MLSHLKGGRFFPGLIRFLFLCVSVQLATACTVCETGTGPQLRAGIFGDDFGQNILATLAPMPILILAAIALSHFLGTDRKRYD